MPAERKPALAHGIPYYGRVKRSNMSGKWKFAAGKGPKKVTTKAPVRARPTASKWYSADHDPKPLNNNHKPKPAKLRKNITPGTILITLSGRHHGKHCVFLKQMPSGMLLVTGPYKVNGMPVRRVNQSFVIATSAKVDVSDVNVESVTDAQFKRPKTAKKSGEAGFMAEEGAGKKGKISAEFKALQKSVDTAILNKCDKVMRGYLNSKFTLRNGQYPHLMKF